MPKTLYLVPMMHNFLTLNQIYKEKKLFRDHTNIRPKMLQKNIIESSCPQERKHKTYTEQPKRSSFMLFIPPSLTVCIRPMYQLFQLHHCSWFELLGTKINRPTITDPPTGTCVPLH